MKTQLINARNSQREIMDAAHDARHRLAKTRKKLEARRFTGTGLELWPLKARIIETELELQSLERAAATHEAMRKTAE